MMMSPGSRCVDQLVDRVVDERGRDHDPHRTRLLQLADELLDRERAGSALSHELLDGLPAHVVGDALWPSRISRRTRLAPMRPRPTMPSCMLLPFVERPSLPGAGCSTRREVDHRVKRTTGRKPSFTKPGRESSLVNATAGCVGRLVHARPHRGADHTPRRRPAASVAAKHRFDDAVGVDGAAAADTGSPSTHRGGVHGRSRAARRGTTVPGGESFGLVDRVAVDGDALERRAGRRRW